MQYTIRNVPPHLDTNRYTDLSRGDAGAIRAVEQARVVFVPQIRRA